MVNSAQRRQLEIDYSGHDPLPATARSAAGLLMILGFTLAGLTWTPEPAAVVSVTASQAANDR